MKIRNPHYVANERVVTELVKESTALIKLLRQEPGNLDAAERKQQSDELMAKLEKRAQALQPPTPEARPEPPTIKDAEEG